MTARPDRAPELLAYDRTLAAATGPLARPILVGFDEAGRGALAGPIAVGCVSLDVCGGNTDRIAAHLAGIDDSKRLTPRRREQLFAAVSTCARWSIGAASPAEIDRWGIVPAAALAAQRAYRRLGLPAALGLFDRGLSLRGGPTIPAGRLREIAITHGDAQSLHIAAASIVAKVLRDRWMSALDPRFPVYGLARHKGYGTAHHRTAIETHGVTPIHRRTFL